MVRILRPEADNRAVLMIKPFALPVAFGELQSFLAPDALHFLVIDLPAFNVKEFSNLAIPISTILFVETDQGQTQFLVTVLICCLILLSGTRNSNDTTCSTFRSAKLLASVDDCLTKNLNRQAFGFK